MTSNTELKKLLKQNKIWAKSVKHDSPEFFKNLSQQQSPKYLWIGCSDSRVPANQILGMEPGSIFVHRNVGNIVYTNDLNIMAVLKFSIDVLGVEEIIVCGHYGCGAVREALNPGSSDLISQWVGGISQVYRKNIQELESLSEPKKWEHLCELHVKQQVRNVCHSVFVRGAWNQGRKLLVHGLVYSIKDGVLKDLEVTASGLDSIPD